MRCPRPRKHGLKLSQRCQSRRREPRRKRRKASAPRKRAAALWVSAGGNVCWCQAAMVGMRLSALRLPSLRMILSENRTPLFGIMREPEANLFLVRGGRQRLGRLGVARRVSLARHCERQRSNPEACAGSWIASSRSLLAMTRSNGEAINHTRSSLPGLTRQSMQSAGWLRFVASLDSP
jgi:hypothetical protein